MPTQVETEQHHGPEKPAAAGLPVWGSNRPNVLLWIALGDGHRRELLGETGADEFNIELKRQAQLRGLPVYYPLWDLEDTASLSLAEIWGSFLDRIDRASSRYQPDTILTARLQQESSGLWSANWNVNLEGRWRMNEVDIGTGLFLIQPVPWNYRYIISSPFQ